MSSKIFKGIWIVALSVFLASFVFIMCISYNYFTELQKSRLKNEAELAAQGAANSGINYFDDLNTEGYRITWIGADGSVLYDNEADTAGMENHIEREEVRKALTEGYGESARYSDTLSDKQLYAAKRLPDGAGIPDLISCSIKRSTRSVSCSPMMKFSITASLPKLNGFCTACLHCYPDRTCSDLCACVKYIKRHRKTDK